MTDLLLVYITCEDVVEAKKIGRHLLEQRVAGCINIFPNMEPMFWWPPKEGKINESSEVVLIAKTVEAKYEELEKEVLKVHSFDTACVIAIPVKHVSQGYYDWLVGEIDEN
jgi:periplasmic divalent cation tolerance protein